jgi:hypothetical protein
MSAFNATLTNKVSNGTLVFNDFGNHSSFNSIQRLIIAPAILMSSLF